MKLIILAGGFGTRISEETDVKPKPMVLLGEKPILWHVMNIFAKQGVTEFIVATGYKSEVIHEWITTVQEPWSITPLNTGLETQTAGRIKMCIDLIEDARFFVTYGDGVGNIDLGKLLQFHEKSSRLATVTAVRPPARFGVLESSNGEVIHFGEKSQADAGWINGGFFVLEREVNTYISNLNDSFEAKTLPLLVEKKALGAYHHEGFWQPMDTLREKNLLTEMAMSGNAPWYEL
jgi:glucose-1-phosphate cytidylyltransferase